MYLAPFEYFNVIEEIGFNAVGGCEVPAGELHDYPSFRFLAVFPRKLFRHLLAPSGFSGFSGFRAFLRKGFFLSVSETLGHSNLRERLKG